MERLSQRVERSRGRAGPVLAATLLASVLLASVLLLGTLLFALGTTESEAAQTPTPSAAPAAGGDTSDPTLPPPDVKPWMALAWPLSARDLAGAPAKYLFGRAPAPTGGPTEAIGFYAKGCLAGAVALPLDGPDWQVMRLSRNRHWGTPNLVSYIERTAAAARRTGWPGLLVGDMSQPRGGPMPTGHASHQIGLDVDLWYEPMPARRLSADERETLSASSMLIPGTRDLDRTRWTPALSELIRVAASDPEVERIFVHPAIKAELCRWATGDRTWLGRVRAYWGHDDHFHVRLACPPGMASCQPQKPVPPGDGCGAELAWWFTDEPWKPAPKSDKPPPPPMLLAALPAACRAVIAAPGSDLAAPR